MLKEYDNMKEEIKSPNNVEFTETKYKRLQKPSVYIKKQFDRYWWWHVFNSLLFNRNK